MYKINVPISIDTYLRSDKDELLKRLRETDAERVFVTIAKPGERSEKFAVFKEIIDFLHGSGYEVGAWLWSFEATDEKPYTHTMRWANGDTAPSVICPSDDAYRAWLGEYLRELAELGPDLIMLDDDLRYGFVRNKFGCLCENHLDKISEILGERVTAEQMREKLLRGGRNRYRDAFIAANGYWLERFVREMREAIDKADPNVRFGQCSCMTSWDIDGTTPDRISRIMAGGTKPFYRLIGAPYWAALSHLWGQRLQDVIELSRMEKSRNLDPEIEIFCEGDVYPRPRWHVPAAYLEGFDTAVRAANCTDGILKYMFDYTSGVGYEPGYMRRHRGSKELYSLLDKYFAPKTSRGVRVYESQQKYATQEIYERMEYDCAIENIFFSPAAQMLACSAIPTVYEGTGICGIVFGESARSLPLSAADNGLILDIEAAELLHRRGIDTGIADIGDEISVTEEHFFAEDEYVSLYGGAKARRITLKDGAEPQSEFISSGGTETASYFYENKNGQRFLVFAFEGYFSAESLRRQYTRARQLAGAVRYLSGKDLPAAAKVDAPDLYMQCKEKDGELAVGLWNFCVDSVLSPEIRLTEQYSDITFINCGGNMSGNRVTLSDIPPFGFAGFNVKI